MKPGFQKAVVLVAAVASVLLTTSLGRWQLRRAEVKLARQADMLEQGRLAPLNNASVPCDAHAWAQQQHRRVELRGHWLTKYSVMLDNRAMSGRAGFYVVTPLQLDAVGACAARVVLVQRGWLPRNSLDRTRLPPFLTPDGLVTLQGRLIDEPSRAFSLGVDLPASTASGPRIVQNIDSAGLARQLGQLIRPGAVLQMQPEVLDNTMAPGANGSAEDSSHLPLLRDWPAPASDVGKHHAYAAQWFAMAALITGLYVWFQLIRPFRQRPR
ncbi:MAG: SURF1 family protein [Burkholderiales bacterium]|nr:SURF1 family protein [Burkholderiales bacterium]